jgi:hypothetical protein
MVRDTGSLIIVSTSQPICGYLLFPLIVGPHLKKTHGMGSMNRAKKPRRDVAHPTPRALYTAKDVSNVVRKGRHGKDELTLNCKQRKDSTECVSRHAVGCHR